MYQTVLAGSDLNECTKVHYSYYLALVDSTYLRIICDSVDYLERLICVISINTADKYISVIADIDLDITVCGYLLDNLTALTNDFADLVNRNLCLEHLGSILVNSRSALGNSLEHDLIKNVKTSLSCFLECFLYNSGSKSVYLDIHLNSCDTLVSTANLEVHITEEILKTLNINHCHKVIAVGKSDKSA